MKLTFVKERETKNTVRYQEEPEEGQGVVIGTLYVNKHFAKDAEKLVITIERG